MFFSVLLVVKNEEVYIENLLDAVIHQDFPQDDYEIVVVDGNSTDQTRSIIDRYVCVYPERVKVYVNEKGTLPSGWNIGIRHANGQYVIRLDGHSHISHDFLKNNAEVIARVPEATCVGGAIETVGRGFWGKVNSYVYSHPVGVGNSRFRIAKTHWEGYVDTVPYGAYKRAIFEQVGFFNESLRRNEDLEMNARIRHAGGTFYLSTYIRSTYYARDSLVGLLRKSLGDGKWTIIASRQGLGVLRIRHLIPLFVFTLGIILSVGAIFSTFLFYVLVTLFALYSMLILVSSIPVGKRYGKKYVIPTFVTFFLLHVSRGAASFCSLLSKEFWRTSKES